MSFGKSYKWFGGYVLLVALITLNFCKRRIPVGIHWLFTDSAAMYFCLRDLLKVYTVPVLKELTIQRGSWGKYSNAGHSEGRMAIFQCFLCTFLPISPESTMLLKVRQQPTSLLLKAISGPPHCRWRQWMAHLAASEGMSAACLTTAEGCERPTSLLLKAISDPPHCCWRWSAARLAAKASHSLGPSSLWCQPLLWNLYLQLGTPGLEVEHHILPDSFICLFQGWSGTLDPNLLSVSKLTSVSVFPLTTNGSLPSTHASSPLWASGPKDTHL